MAKTRRSSARRRAPDEVDRALLALLRDDARVPIVELGRRLHLGHAAVHDRVRRLQALGYLQGYHARLDYARLDLGLRAYVGLQTQQTAAMRARLVDNLQQMPEVEECAWVTGEFDALIRVCVRDTTHLQGVVFRIIQAGEGQIRARTMVVLSQPFWKPGPAFEAITPSDGAGPAEPRAPRP